MHVLINRKNKKFGHVGQFFRYGYNGKREKTAKNRIKL
jgi:hypothetical protein